MGEQVPLLLIDEGDAVRDEPGANRARKVAERKIVWRMGGELSNRRERAKGERAIRGN